MQPLKIALVQMQSIIGAIDDNMAKIEKFVLAASQQQVDIICFPELAITGYDSKHAPVHQETIPGPSSDAIRALAQTCGLTILVGLIEKSAQPKPYITQLICHPDGQVESYRKTHLGVSEQAYFQAGDQFLLSATQKAIMGIELCWEGHFPEITTILSLRGAEIIFIPHASPVVVGDRKALWMRYLEARAYDNGVFLAACNLIGANGCGGNFCGGALLLGPKGELLAEDFNGHESMLVASLDDQLLNKIRYETRTSMKNSYYPRYRRPELYGDLTRIPETYQEPTS